MSGPRNAANDPSPGDGDTTSPAGTPVAVEVSGDRRDRRILVVLLVGPVVWFTHFMFVYLVAEMGCTGGGQGFERFDHPVPVITTVVATVVAVLMCAATATWGYRWWRASSRDPDARDGVPEDVSGELDGDQRGGSLAFVGFGLSVFSLVAVLFTGVPALALWSC